MAGGFLGAGPCGPAGAEWIVRELLEQFNHMHLERAERRREKSELGNRVARLEHELQAEDQIGRDLTRRLDTLQAAVLRERAQHCGPEGPILIKSYSGGEGTLSSVSEVHTPVSGFGVASQSASDLLAAYLDDLPKVRKPNCKEHLRARLRECGILEPDLPVQAGQDRTRSGGFREGDVWRS